MIADQIATLLGGAEISARKVRYEQKSSWTNGPYIDLEAGYADCSISYYDFGQYSLEFAHLPEGSTQEEIRASIVRELLKEIVVDQVLIERARLLVSAMFDVPESVIVEQLQLQAKISYGEIEAAIGKMAEPEAYWLYNLPVPLEDWHKMAATSFDLVQLNLMFGQVKRCTAELAALAQTCIDGLGYYAENLLKKSQALAALEAAQDALSIVCDAFNEGVATLEEFHKVRSSVHLIDWECSPRRNFLAALTRAETFQKATEPVVAKAAAGIARKRCMNDLMKQYQICPFCNNYPLQRGSHVCDPRFFEGLSVEGDHDFRVTTCSDQILIAVYAYWDGREWMVDLFVNDELASTFDPALVKME